MKLIIEDDEGRKTVVPFVRDEISIGRKEGNTIRLTERNVSRRHARLLKQNSHVFIEDLGSYNGVKVNGGKVQGRAEIREGDLIEIGDYNLAVQVEAGELAASPNGAGESPTAPVPVPPQPDGPTAEHDVPPLPPQAKPAAPPPPAPPPRPAAAAPPPMPAANGTPAPAPSGAPPPMPAPPPRREATAIIKVDLEALNREAAAKPLPPDDQPTLVVLTTEYAGSTFAVDKTIVSIGRDASNDVPIDHRSMSRNHCRVFLDKDGTWKVVDLASANGVRVNGEEYGLIDLRRGDVIELGHVKLRFCDPGEGFVFSEEVAAAYGAADADGFPGVGKSRMPLIIGAAAFVAVAGGLSLYLMTRSSTPSTTTAGKQPTPIVLNGSAKKPTPTTAPSHATPTPQPRHVAAGAATGASVAKELADGRAALKKRDWDAARRHFRQVLAAEPGQAEATEGARQAAAEATAQASLQDAQKAADQKDYKTALARLGEVSETSVYHDRAASLHRKVISRYTGQRLDEGAAALKRHAFDEAHSAVEDVLAVAPKDGRAIRLRSQIDRAEHRAAAVAARTTHNRTHRTTQHHAKTAPTGASPKVKEAQTDFTTGYTLLKKGRYKQAITYLKKALQLDPTGNKRAHRLLGIAYASVGDMDKAAYHYREYVRLNPNAPDRSQVERILQQYEQATGGGN